MGLQQTLDDAVTAGRMPFVVGMTASAAGVRFQGAAGEAAPGRPAAPDTVFRIFSMTKAVGSTAAMILVDRGELDLEAPVESLLPEFARLQVLEGWDGEKPRLRAPRGKATVRQLATHTSGLEYEFWCPQMAEYLTRAGRPSILAGTLDSMNYPLMSDPGTRWGYGISIDWLGRVVEKVSGQRIDAFLRQHLFDPLGLADTDVEVRAHMAPRLAGVKARGPDGAFVDFDLAPPSGPEFYGMGHALYSTPQDYLRFLRLFLNRGTLDGARVLSEAGVERMLANHLGPLRLQKMVTAMPQVTADFDPFPGTRVTHSLGFMRNEEDIPGRRRAGSQGWAGVLNTHYWFDLSSDLAAVLMTQTLPFVEPPVMTVYDAFERAAYAA
ncbi:MAG TPA: serine hydrolase domain-containing protein [Rubrivivax sp.]|nr:serine hydrolase domain-containing protein [Rubrivivax sp.]